VNWWKEKNKTMEYKYLEVFVQNKYDNGSVEIWVHQNMKDGPYNMSLNGTDIEMRKIDNEYLTPGLKPFIVLPHSIARHLLKELAIQLNNFGIKPENESRTEGKLEATEKHLEDMREIANKLLNSKLNLK